MISNNYQSCTNSLLNKNQYIKIMTDNALIKTISYIKRSRNRINIVLLLGENFKIPSELARDMNLKISQISAILSDLKKEGIVVCINEEEKVGRIYKLTEKGKNAYEIIKKK